MFSTKCATIVAFVFTVVSLAAWMIYLYMVLLPLRNAELRPCSYTKYGTSECYYEIGDYSTVGTNAALTLSFENLTVDCETDCSAFEWPESGYPYPCYQHRGRLWCYPSLELNSAIGTSLGLMLLTLASFGAWMGCSLCFLELKTRRQGYIPLT